MKAILFFLTLSIGPLLAGDPITAGSFEFKPPAPWVAEDYPSHMVKGALRHSPKAPLLKIFHFGPGRDSGIEANIKRWKKEFESEVKITPEKKSYGKQEVVIVAMEGIFLDGGIMERKTEKAGWTLLAAIMPHETGDVTLKIAGPTAEVMKSKKDFEALIASAFPKE
ncbi:MAG: hypothetical protein QNL33_16865 [Akkermansiaceae bacterium]|jgi:hypothetical protein